MIKGCSQGFEVTDDTHKWHVTVTPYILGDKLYLEIRWIDNIHAKILKELLVDVQKGAC